MNENVMSALREIYSYANHVDDWIVIKKELLRTLHPTDRKLFSTRDPITKRQRTNDFERNLAKIWEDMTHRPVVFKDDENSIK